jgi:type 1 glutamine amidotransferase
MFKCVLSLLLSFPLLSGAQDEKSWIRFEGKEGPGKGKHIVMVGGDEEYRSEEALPMLAKILSAKHGFTCTVLFSIDPASGEVDANNQTNIPGLETLRSADLLFIFTRFRELPDSQMKHIDEYLKTGKPVIGLRTSTHAFAYKRNIKSKFAHYSFDSKVKGWEDGFGKRILGETWVDHHGIHGKEGTRALLNGIEKNGKNKLLNGVTDIWVPTDVYTVRRLDSSTNVLLFGQSTNGMNAEAPVNLEKSIMPVAWTRTYSMPNGKRGKVFATTMGASVDLVNDDLRRLIVNACYWATGKENAIPEKADVQIDGKYQPTFFGFESFKKGKRPQDFVE